MYRIDNHHRRLEQCVHDLVGAHDDGLREGGHEVAAADFHGDVLRALAGAADVHLDVLGGTFTDEEVVLLPHVTEDGLIEVVAGDLDRFGNDRTVERDYGDIRGTTTDVDDHIALWLTDVDAGADCSRYRLLDDRDLAGTCMVSGILDGLLLDLGCATRDADRDARLPEGTLADGFINEVLQHLLRQGVVRDDALAQRTDRRDVLRGAAQHETRVLTVRKHGIRVAVDSHHGRLLQNDAAAFYIYKDAGGTQIDADII